MEWIDADLCSFYADGDESLGGRTAGNFLNNWIASNGSETTLNQNVILK
jgi:hypothetical protein